MASGNKYRVMHGKSRTPTYRIWKGMVSRCYTPSATGFENYGGRGIGVCERWRRFDLFVGDMGPRPSKKHSLDRIDSNGSYEPGNCRWVERMVQSTNKRNNVVLTAGGQSLCLSEWSRKSGVSPAAIKRRLRNGWPVDRAVSEPADQGRKRFARVITANGETKTVLEWAAALGITTRSVRLRLQAGWDEERAVTTPPGVKREA